MVKALSNGAKGWETTDEGLTLREGRIYVPKDRRLREDIIRAHHDSCVGGHPGQYKTQELITHNYW